VTILPIVVDGNLILTGTGGAPGGSYTWITSTKVARVQVKIVKKFDYAPFLHCNMTRC
jgi:hypothetical protein